MDDVSRNVLAADGDDDEDDDDENDSLGGENRGDVGVALTAFKQTINLFISVRHTVLDTEVRGGTI
jgi:hypothetical protein